MKTEDSFKIEAQITLQQKELFSRAAAVSGMSLSDFVKSALVEKTKTTMQEYSIIDLSLADQEQLAKHLLHPPESSDDLEKLSQWRKQQEQDA
jgi:uncharacterized protein (DUF1778 family)